MTRAPAELTTGARVLAAAFATSGVIHLVRPQVFEAIVPPYLPAHRELVLASGVAEIACAAGLAVPATRRAAGWGSIALLLAVFPANVEMSRQYAAKARRHPGAGTRAAFLATLARLPLQATMIRDAYRATR